LVEAEKIRSTIAVLNLDVATDVTADTPGINARRAPGRGGEDLVSTETLITGEGDKRYPLLAAPA
jgi:hypothetical protein